MASRFTKVLDVIQMTVCFFVFTLCTGMAFRSNASEAFLIWTGCGMVFMFGVLWLAIEIYRGRWGTTTFSGSEDSKPPSED